RLGSVKLSARTRHRLSASGNGPVGLFFSRRGRGQLEGPRPLALLDLFCRRRFFLEGVAPLGLLDLSCGRGFFLEGPGPVLLGATGTAPWTGAGAAPLFCAYFMARI